MFLTAQLQIPLAFPMVNAALSKMTDNRDEDCQMELLGHLSLTQLAGKLQIKTEFFFGDKPTIIYLINYNHNPSKSCIRETTQTLNQAPQCQACGVSIQRQQPFPMKGQ